ncbi:carbamoyltransferase [Massilia varians]|uniref:Carbamoyltransferase n=1 Tax=Massilia varians TaxID=457921 RepID=A0ABN6T2U0_9BURK|nr:carbamoyltransferase C-terminal domain-containing protein [Massilia varians]BDT56532.1 carbamoyltransferase [Massilia varians]
MDDTPVVLGINRTQDASICLMQGSHLAWAIQKERLTRHKHHWGKPGDLRDHYAPRLPGLERPVDIVVECFSSDEEIGSLPVYDDELAATLALARDGRRARISHHLAHLYSVFHPSPFDEAAVMVIDGQGSPVSDFTEHWSDAATTPGDRREVASFYSASRKEIRCIGKQVRPPDGSRHDDGRLVGLGMFYFLLTQAIFPGEGNEGKVMGLAPYGDPAALGLPPLDVEGMAVGIPSAWRALLRERSRFRFGSAEARFTDCANLAAAGQRAFEDALLALAHWLYRQTGAEHLCFAGGTALNCSANERLLRETPFRRMFLPPAPSDAGTALGCAIYGLTELAGRPCDFRWSADYLGPPPQLSDIEAALDGATDLVVERPRGRDALCARMLDLLCTGRVVGLYQGRSEFGPRALGHRSILADPRRDRIRDWINARIKQREWFRPLAPLVPEERAAVYFDVAGPSPFMQFAAPVRPEVAPMLPAITHVDGTARLQTVGPADDPLLRALLAGFEVRTGVPVLLNTSFNGRNEPIVETPFEAVAAFRQMPLHALAIPPFLVTKRSEPELPV